MVPQKVLKELKLKRGIVWLVPRKESKFKEVKEMKRDVQPFLEDKRVKTHKKTEIWSKWQNFEYLRNFQAFRMSFFQRKLHEQLAYQKLGRFIAAFGSYRSKLSQLSILAKKWPNFGLKWPKLRHIRIFLANEYDFLKEDHKKNFHTKN